MSESAPQPTAAISRAERFDKGLDVIAQNINFQSVDSVFKFVGGLKTAQTEGVDKGKTAREFIKLARKKNGSDATEVLANALIEHIASDASQANIAGLRADYELGLAMGLLDRKRQPELRALLKDINVKYLKKELTPNQLKKRQYLKKAALVTVGGLVASSGIAAAADVLFSKPEVAAQSIVPNPTPDAPTPVIPKPTSQPTAKPSPTELPKPSPTTIHTATPTHPPTPTPVAIEASPTAVPEKEVNVIDEVMPAFIQEAQKRRQERLKNPEYKHRIDAELNKDRINFMLFGYGMTYERPEAPNIIGSPTVFSYNTKSKTWDIVSVTHDLRAPEVERYVKKPGEQVNAIKLDRAYFLGGMDLMQQTLEDATGLSLDFKMALNDVAIRDLVDQIFGGLTVTIPKPIDTDKFYIENEAHPGGHIKQGRQTLDGTQVLQYMKAMPMNGYNRDLERNLRKQFVFEALMKRLFVQDINPGVIAQGIQFIASNMMLSKHIESDFTSVLTSNATKIMELRKKAAPKSVSDKDAENSPVMKVNKNVYIVNAESGDGGVEWVTASPNPITKKDLQRGIYIEKSLAVPGNGANPYSPDLVKDYWQTTRELVKTKLS